MGKNIVIYGPAKRPAVQSIRSLLYWSNIDFEFVNVVSEKSIYDLKQKFNRRAIDLPIIEFADGSIMVNPKIEELRLKLSMDGFVLRPTYLSTYTLVAFGMLMTFVIILSIWLL